MVLLEFEGGAVQQGGCLQHHTHRTHASIVVQYMYKAFDSILDMQCSCRQQEMFARQPACNESRYQLPGLMRQG